MSMGVYTLTEGMPYINKVCQGSDIHTGVGFCVARSDYMGNAKVSSCGTGRVRVPRFFRKYTNQPYENNRRIRDHLASV